MNEKGAPHVLMLASVASMIDLFNAVNVKVLDKIGCVVDVAANFQFGSITSQERVDQYKSELIKGGNQIYDIPIPRSIFDLKNIIKSYQIIRSIANTHYYNIIHVHSPIGGVLGRLAFRNARRYGTKVIYTAHGFHFYKGAPLINWALFYPLEKWCSRYTDVLLTINKEDFQSSLCLYAKRNEYVPGIGINVNEFRYGKEHRIKIRTDLGLNESDFVLMSSGQLSVRKNHRVVIKAIGGLHNPHIKYLISGFGELENNLQALIKELKLENQVFLLGYRSDVKDILHAVDAFAMPSLQEGLSVSLMEAMAAGLPVICSKIRGNVDLVEDGKGGFLYDPYDVDGFSEGINRLYQHRNDNSMGLINAENAWKYDVSVVEVQMDAIYKSVLNS